MRKVVAWCVFNIFNLLFGVLVVNRSLRCDFCFYALQQNFHRVETKIVSLEVFSPMNLVLTKMSYRVVDLASLLLAACPILTVLDLHIVMAAEWKVPLKKCYITHFL